MRRIAITATIFSLFLVADQSDATIDICPDGTEAEKNRQGVVTWCGNNEDCSRGWTCTPTGKFHFHRAIKYCCQTREYICSQAANPGYGECFKSPVTKFFFDNIDLTCKPFKVISCGNKNQNQFASYEQCTRFCQSTACESGESLLLSRSNKPVECRDGMCPDGYRCVKDKLFRKNVCCGFPTTGVCPIGMVSYTSALTSRPLQCSSSPISDPCPYNFVCSIQGLKSFCCSPHDDVCPMGEDAYIHDITKRTVKCNPQEPNSCPRNFYCSSAVPGSVWGFCCSRTMCPAGTQAFIDTFMETPQRCTIGVTQCPVGYSCQSSFSNMIIGFCCTLPRKKLSQLKHQRTSKMDKKPDEYGSERYFIHNEGVVDPMKSEFVVLKKVSKSTDKVNKEVLFAKQLTCSPGFTNMYYQSTQLIIECTSANGFSIQCPGESICVRAHEDVSERSVCCLPPPTTTPKTFIYYITAMPTYQTYQTKDRFCRLAIRSHQCTPSEPTCPPNFFCQYTTETNGFACCSFNSS